MIEAYWIGVMFGFAAGVVNTLGWLPFVYLQAKKHGLI